MEETTLAQLTIFKCSESNQDYLISKYKIIERAKLWPKLLDGAERDHSNFSLQSNR